MRYDFVVVGGGPGGSMTAKTLAEKGAKVLLVEKRPEIGVAVRCAEATGIEGLKALGVKIKEKFIASRTRGAYLYSPDGTLVDMTGEEYTGYVLERRLFDKYLAIYAAEAGAEVRTRTYAYDLLIKDNSVKGVFLKQFGKKFLVKCKAVVGADGIESKIGRMAGLNTRTKLSQMTSNAQFEMVGIDVHEDIMEFYFGREVAPRGYAWVFPKGKDIANVGLGIRNANKPALEYLKNFINSKEHLRKGKVTGVVVGGVPVQGPVEKTYSNGVVLVGDAARHVDPLTGGGIYNAMRCGIIAGEVLIEALERDDFSEESLAEYERRWKQAIGDALMRSLRVKEGLEKLNDEQLNQIAKLLSELKFGSVDLKSVDLKDVTKIFEELPPDVIEFLQGLL